MKSFQFESIWLLSHRDKKARKVVFHPRRNLVQGTNHTGKSSLVKNLFITLGATPAGKLEQWDPHTISAVEFKVAGNSFRVVHHDGARALYDSTGELLTATDSHQAWSEAFANLVGFNLVVTLKKDGSPIVADPACFFLPFYIDQDGSWRERWDTFPALLRFKAPVQSILEYFSGVKPAEYYALRGEQSVLSKEVEAQVSELRLLERAHARLSNILPVGTVNFSEVGFADEIKRLTTEASELNARQEKFRAKLVRESEIISSIRRQIDVAFASLREYWSDQKYLSNIENAQELICPTCGAQHENSFLHYLGYAEDARILEELARTLQKDLVTAEAEQRVTLNELASLQQNYNRINKILETKRGEMLFSEVVESHGAQAAHRAFDIEREQISIELGTWNTELQKVLSRLAELTDKKRSKKIIDEFRSAYVTARRALNVPDPAGRVSLLSRPNRSGSGGPRLLLAYYAALWKVCNGDQVGFSVPVVIDSPNQQDQDDVNLHVVLEFIADSLPYSMQLIVCVTKDSNASLDKKILFDKKYSMLEQECYDEVETEIGPLYRRMNAALLNVPFQS